MAKLKVVICPADRAPYLTNISDSLENLQKTVGGYIEEVKFAEDVSLIVNEEGKLRNLPENRSCCFPGFFGDVFFVGVEGGELVSLNDKQAYFVYQQCRKRWEKNATD